jgi:hypoxanthine phosphoribosyltransferase
MNPPRNRLHLPNMRYDDPSYTMRADLKRVLYHESTILSRLDELADQIIQDYTGKELTVIAVLNGSFMFLSDLLRRIPLPLRVDSLSVSSYHGGTESTGVVTFDQANLPDIEGRHVLILDDILDSGHTLYAIKQKFGGLGPKSLKACVLLRKDKVRDRAVDADYVAFNIADEFVVGYGLDFMEHYRNLPYIGVMNEDVVKARLSATMAKHLESAGAAA